MEAMMAAGARAEVGLVERRAAGVRVAAAWVAAAREEAVKEGAAREEAARVVVEREGGRHVRYTALHGGLTCIVSRASRYRHRAVLVRVRAGA